MGLAKCLLELVVKFGTAHIAGYNAERKATDVARVRPLTLDQFGNTGRRGHQHRAAVAFDFIRKHVSLGLTALGPDKLAGK